MSCESFDAVKFDLCQIKFLNSEAHFSSTTLLSDRLPSISTSIEADCFLGPKFLILRQKSLGLLVFRNLSIVCYIVFQNILMFYQILFLQLESHFYAFVFPSVYPYI